MIYYLFFFNFLIFQQINSFKLSNQNDDNINLGIVNGYFTNTLQFPYQVSIFQQTQSDGHGEVCGGVIMNNEWIISAAHCVCYKGKQNDIDKVSIRIGIDRLDGDDVYNKTHKASQIFVHPKLFTSPDNNKYDVALIRLKDQIQYSDNVKPACFDFSNNQYDYLIASGFGKVTPSYKDDIDGKFDEVDDGDQLKYAFLRETRNTCEDNHSYVCVDSYFSKDSPCYGDSGGPLSTDDYNVIGVFSDLPVIVEDGRFKICNGKGRYIRLSAHVDFINQHVGQNYCIKS